MKAPCFKSGRKASVISKWKLEVTEKNRTHKIGLSTNSWVYKIYQVTYDLKCTLLK